MIVDQAFEKTFCLSETGHKKDRIARRICPDFDPAQIHVLEGAAGLEDVIDQADVLEQLRPIDVGDEVHAGDDVTHCDAAGDLPLVLAADDGFGSCSLPGQLLVEPL